MAKTKQSGVPRLHVTDWYENVGLWFVNHTTAHELVRNLVDDNNDFYVILHFKEGKMSKMNVDVTID